MPRETLIPYAALRKRLAALKLAHPELLPEERRQMAVDELAREQKAARAEHMSDLQEGR